MLISTALKTIVQNDEPQTSYSHQITNQL